MLFKSLESKIQYLSEPDKKLIRRAFDFAEKYHQGQKRKTGEPFINHGLETAAYIAKLRLDAPAVAAAILHDVCEDTPCDLNRLRKEFGKEIAILVDGVTKLGKIRITRRWIFLRSEKELEEYDRQVETLRKMFMAMARDIRVVLIKLADRLHNMKTLEGVAPEKRLRIAKETLEIYAPLADRLGMGELKGKLEDLAFPYVYPKEYQELKTRIASRLIQKERYLNKIKAILLRRLNKEGIKPEIHGRVKHLYSLWKKLKRYDNDLNRIYDLVALRIIVKNVEECYQVLGIIHDTWRPLIGRIKDYIALPKPNGYQSLHTTVFAENGELIEIQIRSKEMHDRAENGVAAHWHYSEKKGTLDYLKRIVRRAPSQDLIWVNELARWQNSFKDNKEVVDGLGMDFFHDRIFVYTPQGDVKNLPAGATPIDFAYAIHTEIGNTTSGAKVNGKMVELSQELQNGDIVQILTKKNSHPSRDWLNFVRTSLARSRIKASLREA